MKMNIIIIVTWYYIVWNVHVKAINQPGRLGFQFVANESAFIDKTELIKEIFNNYTFSAILITAPRRFGKTVNLDMIRKFVQMDNVPGQNSFHDFFNDPSKNFKIQQYPEIIREHEGQYPVIQLSFANVFSSYVNYEEALNGLRVVICKAYAMHAYKLQPFMKKFEIGGTAQYIMECDLHTFQRISLRSSTKDDLKESLVLLTKLLYSFYHRRVVILIDEYDTPLINSMKADKITDDDFKCVIDIVCCMIEHVAKPTPDIEDFIAFTYITGINKFSLKSTKAGLNNVKYKTFLGEDNELTKYIGFTHQDVQYLYNKFKVSNFTMAQLKEASDGYTDTFGSIQIYSPLTVIESLRTGRLNNSAWLNSGTMDEIFTLLQYPSFRLIIMQLITGRSVPIEHPEKSVHIDSLIRTRHLLYGNFCDSITKNDINVTLKILYSWGYLTNAGNDHYRIPNNAIKNEFLHYERIYYQEKGLDFFSISDSLETILLSEDENYIINTVIKELESQLTLAFQLLFGADQKITSGLLEGHVRKESGYKAIVETALAIKAKEKQASEVRVNKKNKKPDGAVDQVVVGGKNGSIALYIEFKRYVDPKEAKKSKAYNDAQWALNQTMNYGDLKINPNITWIKRMGISIDENNQVTVKYEHGSRTTDEQSKCRSTGNN